MHRKACAAEGLFPSFLRRELRACKTQEPARSRLAGRAQQVLAHYLLPGLLMRCVVWKQGGGSSPICWVITGSAGSRFIGDLRALEASEFQTQILVCQLLLMTGGGKTVYFV